ncbi:MAG TPA: DUF1440 domain-containing protein [Terriglobales bacterium]|nr:DUF1440 domain-containing protein [Terriglobales bacterium]
MRRRQRRMLKGVAAGAAGGLVASWAMNQFQAAWSKAKEVASDGAGGQQQSSEESDDATMKTADRVVQPVLGRHLSREEKKRGGPVVHYAFGSLVGAAYGAVNELTPKARTGFGLPYGAAVFVGADEIAVPALGLSQPPQKSPLSTHAYALASHLVYGAVLEGVRRGVRRVW